MPDIPQLNVGDSIIDRSFFAEHPDALSYVRWATAAECDAQQLPIGTVLIVIRRSPADKEYFRVWCRPEPGQLLHPTFGVFRQLPKVPQQDEGPSDDLAHA